MAEDSAVGPFDGVTPEGMAAQLFGGKAQLLRQIAEFAGSDGAEKAHAYDGRNLG